MAIYYFGALFGVLFSTFYFLYGADRLSMDRDPQTAGAQVFALCHHAAVTHARTNAALGAGATLVLACNGASLTSAPAGLNVNGIIIRINPGADVGIGSGRVVVTYLLPGTAMNTTPFETVRSDLGNQYTGDPSVGQVQTIGAFQAISNTPGVVTRVPAIIPAGAMAMVTSVQP